MIAESIIGAIVGGGTVLIAAISDRNKVAKDVQDDAVERETVISNLRSMNNSLVIAEKSLREEIKWSMEGIKQVDEALAAKLDECASLSAVNTDLYSRLTNQSATIAAIRQELAGKDNCIAAFEERRDYLQEAIRKYGEQVESLEDERDALKAEIAELRKPAFTFNEVGEAMKAKPNVKTTRVEFSD